MSEGAHVEMMGNTCVPAARPAGTGSCGCRGDGSLRYVTREEIERRFRWSLRPSVHEDVRDEFLFRWGNVVQVPPPSMREMSCEEWLRTVTPLVDAGDVYGIAIPSLSQLPMAESLVNAYRSGIIVPEGAGRSVVYHELVHGYAHPRFWQWGLATLNPLRRVAFEALTERITRAGGYRNSAYDDIVDESITSIPLDLVVGALFGGNVDALMTHLLQVLEAQMARERALAPPPPPPAPAPARPRARPQAPQARGSRSASPFR